MPSRQITVVPWIVMTQAPACRQEPSGATGRAPRSRSLMNGFQRLVAIGAVLGICMMPVEYRGGAQTAHAHALFQLFSDAAHGSLDHHGNTFRTLPDRASDVRSQQRAMLADASRAESPALQAPPPPIEQPLAVVALVVAALVVAALALTSGHRVAACLVDASLVGRTVRPTAPPPRLRTLAI